jgi:hypothetical protein
MILYRVGCSIICLSGVRGKHEEKVREGFPHRWASCAIIFILIWGYSGLNVLLWFFAYSASMGLLWLYYYSKDAKEERAANVKP